MRIGDVVVPSPNSNYVLACGCGWYTHAIVASMDPFVLVSEQGDMRWSATIKPEYFIALCQAHPEITARAIARWESDKNAQPVS